MKKVTSILISLIIILVCEIIPINTVLCDENKETKPGNNTIAVLDLEAKSGVDKDTTLMMTEVLRNLIMKTGKYRLLARDKMEEVLKEQNFSTSGRCSTTECQLKIGEILVVQYLVAGTVGKLGKTYIISVQLINVEKGEVVKSALEEAENEETFRIILDKIANTILETSEVVVQGKTESINLEKIELGGMLDISSTPSGADIKINDNLIGKTPLQSKLAVGTYKLVVEKQGFKAVSKNITIKTDQTYKDSINLEKILLTGSLEIKSDPEGAKVVINGVEKGTTPLKIESMETGTYRITLVKEGYKENQKETSVKFNSTTTENFTLEKAETGGGAGWVLWVVLGAVVIGGAGAAVVLSGGPKPAEGLSGTGNRTFETTW